MANKPTENIAWGEGGSPIIDEPIAQRSNGYPTGFIPSAGNHNFQFRAIGRWLDWLGDGSGNYDTLEDFIAGTLNGDRGLVTGLDTENHVGRVLEQRIYTTAATNVKSVCTDGEHVFVLGGDETSADPRPSIWVYDRKDLSTAITTINLTWGRDGTNDNEYHRIVCNGAYVAALTTEGIGATPLSAVTVCSWNRSTQTLVEDFYLRHGGQANDIAIDGAYAYLGGEVVSGVTTRAVPLDAGTGNLAPGAEVVTVQSATAITTAFAADDVVVASGALFDTNNARRKDIVTISGSTSNDGTYLVLSVTNDTTLRVMNTDGSPVVFVAEAAAGTVAVARGWNHNHTAGVNAVSANGQWVVTGGDIATTHLRVFDVSGTQQTTYDTTGGTNTVGVGQVVLTEDRFFYVLVDTSAGTYEINMNNLPETNSTLFTQLTAARFTRQLVTSGATSRVQSTLDVDDRYLVWVHGATSAYALVIYDWQNDLVVHTVPFSNNLATAELSVCTDGDQIYAIDSPTSSTDLYRVARGNRDRIWRRVVPSLTNQVLPKRQLAIPEGG